MYINLKKWMLCADGYPELYAETPCSMYSALLAEKLIDNPFFGGNEEKITKLSEKDCVFKTEFEISEDFENKNAILRFNGLDTLCDITLNGCPVCSMDNMHRRYDIDCAKYLRIGKNQISIYFHSPLEYVKRADAQMKLFVNPDSYQKGKLYVRLGLGPDASRYGHFPRRGAFHIQRSNARQPVYNPKAHPGRRCSGCHPGICRR